MAFFDFFKDPTNVLYIFLTILLVNTVVTFVVFTKKKRDEEAEARKKSKITKITSLSELENDIMENNTIWFIDIDETIVYPTKTQFIADGHPKVEKFLANLEKSLPKPLYDQIYSKMVDEYYNSPMDLVEGKTTVEFLERMSKHCKSGVYGITSRSLDSEHSEILLSTLEKLGVLKFFTKTLPSSSTLSATSPNVAFKNGIIFTSFTNKGEAMGKLLNETGLAKKANVFFMDDTFFKIKQASEVFLREGIFNHELIHYKYVERKIINYKGLLYQFSDYFKQFVNPNKNLVSMTPEMEKKTSNLRLR